MEAFGIIGMSMGTMGFIFGMNAMNQVSKLEKQLKEAGLLPEEPDSAQNDSGLNDSGQNDSGQTE